MQLQKMWMVTLILLCSIGFVNGVIYVTNENITIKNDWLNSSEPFNVSPGANLLMYNTTLNHSIINNGSGQIRQTWYVTVNVTTNTSNPIKNVTITVNDTLGWNKTGQTNNLGQYNVNLTQRRWNNSVELNLTPHNFRVVKLGYRPHNFSANITGNVTFHIKLNWVEIVVVMFGLSGIVFMGIASHLGAKHKNLESFGLLSVAWISVLLSGSLLNIAELNANNDVISNLTTFYIVSLWAALFVTGYTLIYYSYKLYLHKQQIIQETVGDETYGEA